MKKNKIIQKFLGRAPNTNEALFLTAFQKSVTLQNTFRSESGQVYTQSTIDSPLMLVAQGNDDVRGQMAIHTINAKIGTKIGIIDLKEGSILMGHAPIMKKHVNPLLGRIYFVKGTKKESTINALKKIALNMRMIPVNKAGMGYSLFRILETNDGCGIHLEKYAIKHMSSKRGHGILIHIDKQSVSILEAHESLLNKMILVGTLTADSTVIIMNGSKSIGHFPMQLLMMISNQERFTDEIKMQLDLPKSVQLSIKQKKTYNKELKALLDDVPKSQQVSVITKKGHAYGYATHTNDYIKYDDYKMRSIAAITNGARHLICSGIRPEVATGFLAVPKGNVSEKGSFLKGVHIAGKELNIAIDHIAFGCYSDKPSGRFYVGGQRIINSDFPNTFLSSSQFISILGSHRGELGGSRFLSLKKMDYKGAPPKVDLTMESRLQDAVLTGIHGGLIQSARPIGRGGIATTIARSFPKTPLLGARIHFSRKLTVPELLFGETQGLILVTINEMDLMEFERVCMTIGVPATTIGRVTDDGQYKFNNAIKLSVDTLPK